MAVDELTQLGEWYRFADSFMHPRSAEVIRRRMGEIQQQRYDDDLRLARMLLEVIADRRDFSNGDERRAYMNAVCRLRGEMARQRAAVEVTTIDVIPTIEPEPEVVYQAEHMREGAWYRPRELGPDGDIWWCRRGAVFWASDMDYQTPGPGVSADDVDKRYPGHEREGYELGSSV